MKNHLLLVFILLASCSFSPLRFPTASGDHEGPGCIELASPEQYKKVWSISDVHGQFGSLKNLMERSQLLDSQGHWQARNELLIVVGDSIDKGPYSKEVLDYWIRLNSESLKFNSRIIHLLGNHEAEFLADPTNPKVNFPLPLSQEQMSFLRQMPMALRLGDWIFVHAGKIQNKYSWSSFCKKADDELDSSLDDIQSIYKDQFIIGDDSALEIKDWWKDESLIQDQIQWLRTQHLSGIVFGHQTKAFKTPYQVSRAPQNYFFKIDSGMGDGQVGEMLLFPSPEQLKDNEAPQAFRLMASGQMYKIP